MVQANNKDPKILVIEDDYMHRRLYNRLFVSYNLTSYNLRLCEDGMDALEALKDFDPDLIILDLSMPKMSGIEFLQKIKKKAMQRRK